MKLGSTRPRIAAAPSRLSPAPKKALPFYQSAEWKALREMRRQDADYREALRRARCDGSKRVILDHVREIRDGGPPLDPRNTQWLTFSEHQRKTERAKRARVGRR